MGSHDSAIIYLVAKPLDHPVWCMLMEEVIVLSQ